MTEQPDEPLIDWSATTYEGARREQLRRWSKLSLREIVTALEEMQQLADRLSPPAAGPGEPAARPDTDSR